MSLKERTLVQRQIHRYAAQLSAYAGTEVDQGWGGQEIAIRRAILQKRTQLLFCL